MSMDRCVWYSPSADEWFVEGDDAAANYEWVKAHVDAIHVIEWKPLTLEAAEPVPGVH